MNEPLKHIQSSGVPLPIENVDTDQIIPARFLKAVDMSDFGNNLFRDWRYTSDEELNPHFIINNPIYSGEILVAGKNFGCGSSREHAAWALSQYGFKAVVSSYFADIFKNNALNNGILVAEVSEDYLNQIFKSIELDPTAQISIDIIDQRISTTGIDMDYNFELDPYKKECLISGKDDLDYLLGLRKEIRHFESKQIIY